MMTPAATPPRPPGGVRQFDLPALKALFDPCVDRRRGGCWLWTGPRHRGTPILRLPAALGGGTLPARRVAYLFARLLKRPASAPWLTDADTVTNRCGTSDCVRYDELGLERHLRRLHHGRPLGSTCGPVGRRLALARVAATRRAPDTRPEAPRFKTVDAATTLALALGVDPPVPWWASRKGRRCPTLPPPT